MSLKKPAIVFVGSSIGSAIAGAYIGHKQQSIINNMEDKNFTEKQKKDCRFLFIIGDVALALLVGSIGAKLTFDAIPSDFWDYYNTH